VGDQGEGGATYLGLPSVGPDVAPTGPAQYVVEDGGSYVLSVFDLGLACCAVELVAASVAFPELVQRGAGTGDPAAAPGEQPVQVMVVSGTVTDAMAPAVLRAYQQLPEPRYVLSFGSCANSGGPYWDSYCVTKGVDQLVPVDVYVPGCPPRPEALMAGLRLLRDVAGGDR
jgi:NADH-quinone oxidoreductase subunit B